MSACEWSGVQLLIVWGSLWLTEPGTQDQDCEHYEPIPKTETVLEQLASPLLSNQVCVCDKSQAPPSYVTLSTCLHPASADLRSNQVCVRLNWQDYYDGSGNPDKLRMANESCDLCGSSFSSTDRPRQQLQFLRRRWTAEKLWEPLASGENTVLPCLKFGFGPPSILGHTTQFLKQ